MSDVYSFLIGAAIIVASIGAIIVCCALVSCKIDEMAEDQKHKATFCAAWDETLNALLDSGLPVSESYHHTYVTIGGTQVCTKESDAMLYYGCNDLHRNMGCTRATQQRLRDYIARSRCIEILKKAEAQQAKENKDG